MLREAGAQEKTIPYCMAWVRRFFARHPGRRRRDLGRTEIEVFLADIAQRGGVSNWQVQQARDAMELYYEQLRGIALAPRLDASELKSASEPPSPPTPTPVAELRSRKDAHKTYAAGRRDVKRKHVLLAMEPGAAVGPAPPALRTAEAPPSTGAPTVKTHTAVNWRALDARVRECLRLEHYAYRTEQAYVAWIRRFVAFHQWRKPSRFDNAKGTHRDKAKGTHLCSVIVGPVGSMGKPEAFPCCGRNPHWLRVVTTAGRFTGLSPSFRLIP